MSNARFYYFTHYVKCYITIGALTHFLVCFFPVCGTIAGLKASFDGKRGVVSIVGLQVDQRMGPLDLVAYLYPEAGPKSGVS